MGRGVQSGYRHKITQIRYKGLIRTKKTTKSKEKDWKTEENLRYKGTLVSPSMFLSLCSDCRSLTFLVHPRVSQGWIWTCRTRF